MKLFKKILCLVLVFIALFIITGCNKEEEKKDKEGTNVQTDKKDEKIEGSLEELMTKVYENIPEEERPMMLMNTEINDENIEYYLGSTNIEYEEAIASESGVGSIPHSVVLLRAKENSDIDAIKKEIKNNVNPAKWICVQAEEVTVENRGDLIILVMSTSDNTKKIIKGFNNL